MSLLGRMKDKAFMILLIIALAALGSAFYEHYFSDAAAEIKRLNTQIDSNNQQIKLFKEAYIKIDAELKANYEVIADLKTKVVALEQNLQNDEAKINEIKTKVVDFAAAVDIIAQNAANCVNRSRDVLALFSFSPER